MTAVRGRSGDHPKLAPAKRRRGPARSDGRPARLSGLGDLIGVCGGALVRCGSLREFRVEAHWSTVAYDNTVCVTRRLDRRLDLTQRNSTADAARLVWVSVFGIIRRDPETVLVPPTTTRIPDRTSRAGTEWTRLLGLLLTVRAQSVRSHAVTSSPFFRIRI